MIEVTELDLAKEFKKAALGEVYAGERVTFIIDDEFGGMCFQFKLSKEEIAELVKEDKCQQPT